MADFTALKTAIQTYIKQNGNEEITGNILQEVLLSVVTTLGDSAINDLVTALANEVAARQNADGTLQQNINDEATARGNADTALSNRLGSTITSENTAADQIGAEAEARESADTALRGLIDGITDNIENGYVYAGIATPSSTPVTGKVFYLALTAGTYTNFGSTEVSQGINILKYNGSAWSLDAFIGIDETPTPNSPKLVKSGGAFDSVMTNGSAFDISAHFASGGTLATYADLNAALTALDTLSASYKRGGMSIKFVQSSDNKYVQARCMADEFTTDVTQWQGVDDEPIAGSNSLVKSGGVYEALVKLGLYFGKYIVVNESWVNSGASHCVISVSGGDVVTFKTSNYDSIYYALLQSYHTPSNNERPDFITGYEGRLRLQVSSDFTASLTIPNGTHYLIINNPASSGFVSLKINGVDLLDRIWGVANIEVKTAKQMAQKAESNNAYSVCGTAANTAAKTISELPAQVISNNIRWLVKFTNANTADDATFNTKPLYYRGVRASSSNSWEAGDVLDIRYDETAQAYYAEPWNGVMNFKDRIVNSLKIENIILSNNIANPANIQVGKLIGNKGAIGSLTGWAMIGVPVVSGQVVTAGGFILGRNAYYAFYNNETLVSFSIFRDPNGREYPLTLTTPEGANILYIDISSGDSPSDPYANLMINYGDTLLPYDQYEDGEFVTEINNIPVAGSDSELKERVTELEQNVDENTSDIESIDDRVTALEEAATTIPDIIADLPTSPDGSGIQTGYAYINSNTGVVTVKLS